MYRIMVTFSRFSEKKKKKKPWQHIHHSPLPFPPGHSRDYSPQPPTQPGRTTRTGYEPVRWGQKWCIHFQACLSLEWYWNQRRGGSRIPAAPLGTEWLNQENPLGRNKKSVLLRCPTEMLGLLAAAVSQPDKRSFLLLLYYFCWPLNTPGLRRHKKSYTLWRYALGDSFFFFLYLGLP